MAFKKISRPTATTDVDLGQTLDPGQEIPQVPVEQVEESISQEDFDTLLSNLLEQQRDNGNAQYNSVADQEVYVNNGVPINREQVRALRNNNRHRALQYAEEIEKYKSAYRKTMLEAGIAVPFDRDEEEEVANLLAEYFDSTDSEITTAQYGALKEIQKESAKREGVRYMDSSGFDQEAGFGITTLREGEDLDLGLKKPINVDDIAMTAVVRGIALYENRAQADMAPDGMPVGAALGLGYDSVMEAEEMNNSVISVLSRVDKNTSYIDTILGNGMGSTIETQIGGRPEKFTAEEIWENCFDCFFGAWTNSPDWSFNLDIELRVNGLLDVIRDLLKAIKYALDLPGIITANMCSLMRLGVLCPIEIAFVIANLVSLLRFTITELFMGFGDFLQSLLSAILIPLLNALEAGASFAVAPLNIYTGCVLKTILSTEQINWTGSFTRLMIADILNGRETERTRLIPGDRIDALLEDSKDWTKELYAGVLATTETNRARIDLLDMVGIAGTVDPLDLIDSALLESNSKLQNLYLWIKNALAGMRTYAQSKSVARAELVAKIVVLSTYIGVLVAIGKLLAGNVPVCEEVVDPVTGLRTTEPRFGPEEFIELIGPPPGYDLVPTAPEDAIIIDGEAVPVPSATGSVLVNTLTDTRFSIINCEKGKIKQVSNTEVAATLRQLGLA